MTLHFKIIFISIATLLTALFSNAQEFTKQTQKAMSMRSIGPAGMSGRVTAIDVETNNPEVIYIGTASGGVWKSESGGITWQPIFDEQPTLGIGSIKVNQLNPDEIWVGTGEGNPRNSHTSGAGIYRTIDGGKTWELQGLEATKNIHRVIINQHNPKEVFACAMGSIWGENPERGVFRTRDSGETWENVLFVNDTTGCAELIQDPSNPNKLFAAMWQYGRKPWTFNSGGSGSGLHVTHDGGDTWTELNDKNGLPKGPYGRMGLTISAANPDVVYALIESAKTGLYKSTDGGVNWKLVSTENIGNRPFYYAEIHSDPQNENVIFNLWSYLSKSIDGGKTFSTIMDYPAYHPDHHAFYIHPQNSDFMIEGNDGGLNITRDGAQSWEFVRNLPVAQFYHINVDNEVPYNVYGGMQDNGSWKGPGFVWHVDGIRNEDWKEVLFGDGFDVVPVPNSGGLVYAMYQGGSVHLINPNTGKNINVQPVHPTGENLRFNWNGAISIDPFNDNGVYMGSQFLHYSSDKGNSWKLISPDLTTNDSTKQQQALSGGLTIDATQAENHTTITCITPSQINKDEVWVGTDDGRIHFTTDNGNNWNEVEIKEMPKGSWVAQIEVSKTNPNEVFIAVNDYRRNNFETYLFHSTDHGKKWNNIASQDNVIGYTHCIIQDKKEENLLFMGTEHGLYISLNHGESWNQWTENYPSVATIDLKIQENFSDLVIGTFGRAAYILDDITPLRKMASDTKSENSFVLFNPQQIYQADYSRPNGERFRADHFFSGTNKSRNAKIFYWLELNKDLKPDEQKIFIEVSDESGEVIRKFDVEASDSLNFFSWYGDSKGIRFPSRTKENEKKERGGGEVLPGNFKITANYDGQIRTAFLEVLADPRQPFEIANGHSEGMKQVKTLIESATSTFDQLEDARRSLTLAQKLLENYPDDSTVVQLLDSSKAIIKKIDKLETLFMNHREQVGYEHVTVRLNDLLFNAYYLIRDSSLSFEEGSNSYYALQSAKARYEEVKPEIERFLASVYEPFKKEVESKNLSPFDN